MDERDILCLLDSEVQLITCRYFPIQVFIGESLSARTSSLNIRIGKDAEFHKVKSSGLCVSTGTGSSSWYRAINSLTSQMVKDLLRVADPTKNYTEQEVDKICTSFNDSLQFPPGKF